MPNNVPYTGSCNPPRRVKRPRTDSTTAQVASSLPSTAQRQRPHILPKDAGVSRGNNLPDPESSDDGDDYDPVVPAPPPKRRGRKPGTLSRSARESQRKLNHSRIEKARRTKINETLATLSVLVNEADRQKVTNHESKQDIREKSKGKTEEKEFKLDVLVKAVAYMQELITKVNVLESRQCDHCSAALHTISAPSVSTNKRKHDVIEVEDDGAEAEDPADVEDVYVGDDEKGEDMDDDFEEQSVPPPSPRRSSIHPSPSPRLPPIASWLPHPYVDPSCIAALSDATPSQGVSQLPSPPHSGNFRPAVSLNTQSLPSLTLSAPARPFNDIHSRSIPRENQSRVPPSPMIRRLSTASSRCVASSPTVSPTWTPEDESAASLLLQMSSSPRSSSVSSMTSMSMSKLSLPKAVDSSAVYQRGLPRGMSLQVQTPSSMLGM